ncbi:MAG: hypothetical protein HXX11_10020 [Desulfuromonadales bacterium]|nr:hypothetical protein [Desulfuromonadales bacterium]
MRNERPVYRRHLPRPNRARQPWRVCLQWGGVLSDFSFNGKAECGGTETRTLGQFRTSAIVKTDFRGIAVVGRPSRGVVEEGPNIGSRQACHNNYV